MEGCEIVGRKNANEKMKLWMDGIGRMELETRELRIDYEQAWKDLRNKFIDDITVDGEDIIYAGDLKKIMDDITFEYKYN